MSSKPNSAKAAAGSQSGAKTQSRVISARFELSAPKIADCPAPDVPEIALAGRSNVGKSSLLNALTGQRGLATVSRQPGRTRLLNFFRLRMRNAEADVDLRIVDLPGYGFARANRSVRDTFGPMIQSYLMERVALRALIVLMDARRGPTDLDFDMLEFAAQQNLPSLLCVTKVDKLPASQRGLLSQKFAKELGISPRDIALTSAQTREGLAGDGRRHDLVSVLGQWAQTWSAAASKTEDESTPDAASASDED